ncbi:DUF2127 domain-containing protein [Nakamurella leprariae]|uniref:DUF2127 domain-containing protein n=1 Tax=Nakamurella leprariae TaxID=2803911 RepID=A0A938Y6P3_9ACTN|nr:DUF2127 domain-containing protein [Nakamurella leprariae]MBM9467041.1 DUF2127 domain-containing protein [Nakamurella leprariae]
MDWSLRSCAVRGHETYAPDEPELRDRLRVTTTAGEAWRCLRCGDFVAGPARRSGPADAAPEVPRGRLLRDRTIQRLLAAERVLRAALFVVVVVVLGRFRDDRSALQQAFDTDLALFRPLAQQLGWDVDRSSVVHGIDRFFAWSPNALSWLLVGLVGYAALNLVEAYGLWSMRRWGEYFSVVATSVFLPLEIHEIAEKVTVLRVLLLVVNVLAIVWLIWSKRLFGVRGGGRAAAAEHSAASLLTVERAAVLAERDDAVRG